MVQWNVYHQDKWTNEMYIIKTNGPMKCISSRQMDQWNVYHQDKWTNEMSIIETNGSMNAYNQTFKKINGPINA